MSNSEHCHKAKIRLVPPCSGDSSDRARFRQTGPNDIGIDVRKQMARTRVGDSVMPERPHSQLFYLSAEQLERVKPFFSSSHGISRIDSLRTLSGIMYIIKHGLGLIPFNSYRDDDTFGFPYIIYRVRPDN